MAGLPGLKIVQNIFLGKVWLAVKLSYFGHFICQEQQIRLIASLFTIQVDSFSVWPAIACKDYEKT
jgi:hypothetical protein